MSTGAIAMTAILTGGTEVLAVVAAGAWLVHSRRIVFAATPKAPVQRQGSSGAGQPPADGPGPQGGTP